MVMQKILKKTGKNLFCLNVEISLFFFVVVVVGGSISLWHKVIPQHMLWCCLTCKQIFTLMTTILSLVISNLGLVLVGLSSSHLSPT